MGTVIKVLQIEDNPDDADLALRSLRDHGYDPVCKRVESDAELRRAIVDGGWDVIISDFHLPAAFTGLCALEIVKESGLDIPFIMLTGTIGEDNAAALMKAGADDFILKDLPVRLGPAIARAMADVRMRAERKAAIAELNETNQDLSTLINASPVAIVVLDEQGLARRWNRSATTMFGWQAAEQLGHPLFLLREEGADPLRGLIAKALAGASCVNTEVRCRRKFGAEGDYLVSLAPLPEANERIRGVLLIASDITEQKAAEHHVRHAMKMESLGALAAGVAHEIKTPLQFIGDNLRFLQQSLGELAPLFSSLAALGTGSTDPIPGALRQAIKDADLAYLTPEMPKAVDQAIEGVGRVATIVTALKEFSHPDSGETALANLHQIIESTLNIARNEYKYVAEVVSDFASDLPQVECVQGELSQVILNLVVNAAHAIGDVVAKQGGKGTITISTRRMDDQAEIRIADTGTGIPEHARARIFDPFFTTKEVGKGTGQGLALAHAVIVKKHHGTLTFETAMGQGTTFIIRIPFAQPKAEEPERPAGG